MEAEPGKLKVRMKNHSEVYVVCEPSVQQELSDFFSFFVPGYEYMPKYKNYKGKRRQGYRKGSWDGKMYLYNRDTSTLPTGLYGYLDQFIQPRNYEIEVEHDNYYGLPGTNTDVHAADLEEWIRQLKLSTKGVPIMPRDYQFNGVVQALTEKRAILLSPTSSGKSLMLYLLVRKRLEESKKKILLIVPTTNLVQQMYRDFEDYSQMNDFSVEANCHRIMEGRPKHNIKQRVFISTWQSIFRLEREWFQQFGTILGDECHHFTAKSLTGIMNKAAEADYRIGVTGTLDDAECHKLQLQGHFGRIYRVTTTKDLMDEGSVEQLKINTVVLKYPEAEARAVKKMEYHDEMMFLAGHEKRNNFITNMALDLNGNTLIMFRFVETHGKVLYDLLKEKAHKRRKIFFVSGDTDVETRDQVRDIVEKEKNAIIVGSLGTFSTGVSINNLHNMIFAAPSKSLIKVLQSVGRILRKSKDGQQATMYDIVDDLHFRQYKNYSLRHGAERAKYFSKERFNNKIYEVSFKDE